MLICNAAVFIFVYFLSVFRTNGTKKQLELLLAKHAQNEQENDT